MTCPKCGMKMVHVTGPIIHPATGGKFESTHDWCGNCGWHGTAVVGRRIVNESRRAWRAANGLPEEP